MSTPWELDDVEELARSSYITEMAHIYPKYCAEKNPSKPFNVVIRQSGEGPVPHAHVIFGNISDSCAPTAYVCLHEPIYAPHHKNGKQLDRDEKEELIRFFHTVRRGAFTTGPKGLPVPCNCWRECVDVWINTYSDKLFHRNDAGKILMPDYNKH